MTCAWCPPVRAQDELVVIAKDAATTFRNGGIGSDEVQAMRQAAAEWPLRLRFSASSANEYVANVGLLVADMHGTPYLQLSGAGPFTCVRLPPGKYRVTATLNGQSQTRDVTVDTSPARDIDFHW